MKLVVLYVLPGSGIGGGVNVVLEHTSRLNKAGHKAVILNSIGEINLSWNPIRDYSVLSRFNQSHMSYIRSLDIDVIVATGWQTVYEVAELGLKARSFAYFLQANEAAFAEAGSLDSALASETHRVPFDYFSCASWLKQLVERDGIVCTPIVNGVNDAIFFPDYPLVAKGHKLRVLIEGPIAQPRKRIDDAFLACLPVRHRIDLWCVSSGGNLPQWFQPDLFLESVPMTSMRNIYSACDVIVKLSSAEGMFGPPLEMMACAGTAVTSNCDGHEEYIADEYNALTCDVGDINKAGENIIRLLDEPQLLEKLKTGGIETASRFNWQSVYEKLEKLFFSYVDGRIPTTFREFMDARGYRFEKRLLKEYVTRSYGSLSPPSGLIIGHVFIPCQGTSWKMVMRIVGWSFHEGTSRGANGVMFKASTGQIISGVCNQLRSDIEVGFGSDAIDCGFDFLLIHDCSDAIDRIRWAAFVCPIHSGHPMISGQIDVFLDSASQIRHYFEDVSPADLSDGDHGVIEKGEIFRSLHISVDELPNDTMHTVISVRGTCKAARQYIFVQGSEEISFRNRGVPVTGGSASVGFEFQVDLRLGELAPEARGSIVLLATAELDVRSVRVSWS